MPFDVEDRTLTEGPLVSLARQDVNTGERFAQANASLDVRGDLTVNGEPVSGGGGGGITNSAPANTVPKSDGTNLVASRITDDGTKIDAISRSVRIGDPDDVNNGTWLILDDVAKTAFLRADDNGSTTSLDLTGGATPSIVLTLPSGQGLTVPASGIVALLGNTSNTITSGAAKLELNAAAKTVKLGDVGSVGNDTLVTVDDTNRIIKLSNDRADHYIEITQNDIFLQTTLAAFIGDVDSAGNDTQIVVSDTTKEIELSANSSTGVINLNASVINVNSVLMMPAIVTNSTPTTGQTVSAGTAKRDETLYITPAGTLVALTVELPTSANSRVGQIVRGFISQIITGLTVQVAGSGTVIGSTPITSAVNSTFAYQCASVSGNGTWIRIQ